MPVDQLQRQLQLGVRFFSMWYYTWSEVVILTKKRVVMNWYSFLGHEYSFFNAISSRLIALTLIWVGFLGVRFEVGG